MDLLLNSFVKKYINAFDEKVVNIKYNTAAAR